MIPERPSASPVHWVGTAYPTEIRRDLGDTWSGDTEPRSADDLVRELTALRDRLLTPIVERLARWLAR